MDLADYDKEKQMFLAKGIYEKYGHRTHESVAAAATAEDEIAVKDHIFEALREAVALVTTNGRPNNHLFVVRQLLFTVASARLTPQVRRFRPSTTARGECSTSLFELDETTAPFLVPCHLIRVGKLAIKRIDAAASRTLRGGRGALAAPKYELAPSDKARVYELCRIFD